MVCFIGQEKKELSRMARVIQVWAFAQNAQFISTRIICFVDFLIRELIRSFY